MKKLEDEVEALRAQLGKQAEVAEAESSALKGEVEELRTAMEAKEQELFEATREARQQAEMVTQLRCEGVDATEPSVVLAACRCW